MACHVAEGNDRVLSAAVVQLVHDYVACTLSGEEISVLSPAKFRFVGS